MSTDLRIEGIVDALPIGRGDLAGPFYKHRQRLENKIPADEWEAWRDRY